MEVQHILALPVKLLAGLFDAPATQLRGPLATLLAALVAVVGTALLELLAAALRFAEELGKSLYGLLMLAVAAVVWVWTNAVEPALVPIWTAVGSVGSRVSWVSSNVVTPFVDFLVACVTGIVVGGVTVVAAAGMTPVDVVAASRAGALEKPPMMWVNRCRAIFYLKA